MKNIKIFLENKLKKWNKYDTKNSKEESKNEKERIKSIILRMKCICSFNFLISFQGIFVFCISYPNINYIKYADFFI